MAVAIRKKPWRGIVLGLLLFATAAPASTVSRTADEFVYGSKNLLTWKTAAIFGTGLAATAVATNGDQPLFHSFTYQHSGPWVEFGNFWGTPFPALGLFAATLVVPDNRKFQAFGERLAAALITSTVVSGILKYSVGRTRPSGTNNLSFPSGHTTVAFTLAAVVQGNYGWGWGLPAYALAAVTAAARIADGAHWLSDTVMGATIGIGIAELFRHTEENDAALVPYAFEHRTGEAEYGVRWMMPMSL